MKQSEKTEITKRKILEAAEIEFAQNGLSATKVDDIAKRAGVNKQLIYAHYFSKENLYSTILGIVYDHLGEYEEVLLASTYEGIETIRTIILQYFDFLKKNQNFVRLVLWENLNNVAHLGNVKTRLFVGVENILKDGMDKGMISRELDVEQLAYSFNVFCFSAFSNINTISRLTKRNMSSDEELGKRAEHVADVLSKYIIYANEEAGIKTEYCISPD